MKDFHFTTEKEQAEIEQILLQRKNLLLLRLQRSQSLSPILLHASKLLILSAMLTSLPTLSFIKFTISLPPVAFA